MPAVPRKIPAAPQEILFATCIFLIATHSIFAKAQRGAQGPPLPLYMKKLKCIDMIFRTTGTKKIKKIKSNHLTLSPPKLK